MASTKVKAGVMVVKGVSYLTASAAMWVGHKFVDKVTGKKREKSSRRHYV